MKTFLLILFVFISYQTSSQSFEVPNKRTVRIARSFAQKRLSELRDTLSLTKHETKIKKFSLSECEIRGSSSGGKPITPKGDFSYRTDCPGIYVFEHKTSNKHSYYSMTFFFNSSGELKHTNVTWTMVSF